jgi:hypothetical protein
MAFKWKRYNLKREMMTHCASKSSETDVLQFSRKIYPIFSCTYIKKTISFRSTRLYRFVERVFTGLLKAALLRQKKLKKKWPKMRV